MSTSQVYEKKPLDFKPTTYIVAAYVQVDSTFLLLQLSESKEEAGRWGVPAGKLESGESSEEGVRRELFEETGISVEDAAPIQSLGELYIRKPNWDYIYHMFQIRLAQTPAISLSREHIVYRWLSIPEARELPLMEGARKALETYTRRIP